MSIDRCKLSLMVLFKIGIYSATATASPGGFKCIDHEHRYVLKDFTPTGQGHLGHLTFIDTFERLNVNLFCGFDPSQTNRFEIACIPSHRGSAETIIRARIHVQRDPNLPRVGLIEIQKGPVSTATIDDIVPLVCK